MAGWGVENNSDFYSYLVESYKLSLVEQIIVAYKKLFILYNYNFVEPYYTCSLKNKINL